MAEKRTLGYVQLEWTCPNCNSRNPGGQKTCRNCGAPQPENVQFERTADEKLVTDEQAIKAAAAGADIHCGFCGARNPATATVCSQCGADLKEGKARAAGGVLQAAAAPAVVLCTNCGAENPSTRTMCEKCGAPLPRAQKAASAASFAAPGGGAVPAGPAKQTARKAKWPLFAGIGAAVVLICVAVFMIFMVPASSVQGTVTSVHWQTSVPLEEQREVHHIEEAGEPPSDAYDVSCRTDTRQVCEQKTVDKGNGYGEVVEECHDESTKYCSYDVKEWQTIQTYVNEGNDLSPVYASPTVSIDQRTGSASEDLTVYFDTEKGQIVFSPETLTAFQRYQVGSVWTLKLNAVGGVVSVEQ